MNLALRRIQLMSNVTLPKPTIVLTETSSPTNTGYYEIGEVITITITVTGNSEYDLYNGMIRTPGANAQSWELGTIVGDEYVLAANEVNTFTWTHTVTSDDVNTHSLNFYVYGSGEVMLEETTDVNFRSNTIGIIADTHTPDKDYFTTQALASTKFTLTIPAAVTTSYMTSVSYSIDNGQTWTTTQIDSTAQTIQTPTVSTNTKVIWKGIGTQFSKSTASNSYSHFSSTGRYKVSGNVMSLLYGDDFRDKTTFSSGSNNLSALFYQSTNLYDASELILPVLTLKNNCYMSMFSGCTSLTAPPQIQATTLAPSCFYYMFYKCSSLSSAPPLPWVDLTTHCYHGMFYSCTSLRTAPTLPALTLKDYSYSGMFEGCSRLNYIKAMFTDIPSSTYGSPTYGWVTGVASSGTFVKNSSASWNATGTHAIPSGWTVQTATS